MRISPQLYIPTTFKSIAIYNVYTRKLVVILTFRRWNKNNRFYSKEYTFFITQFYNLYTIKIMQFNKMI